MIIVEENLAALTKVVDYIHDRPEQMNADVTFSVTIVEGNVDKICHLVLEY